MAFFAVPTGAGQHVLPSPSRHFHGVDRALEILAKIDFRALGLTGSPCYRPPTKETLAVRKMAAREAAGQYRNRRRERERARWRKVAVAGQVDIPPLKHIIVVVARTSKVRTSKFSCEVSSIYLISGAAAYIASHNLASFIHILIAMQVFIVIQGYGPTITLAHNH
jgi:hypothetical protein